MSVSTNAIKTRIIDILKTSDAINFATGGTIRNVNADKFFVVFTGDAEHGTPTTDGYAEDLKPMRRRYRILGLIQPMEEGAELSAEAALEPYYDIMEGLFDPRPGLWLNDNSDTVTGVQNSYLESDTGFTAIRLGNIDYAGCEWTLVVEYMKTVSKGA